MEQAKRRGYFHAHAQGNDPRAFSQHFRPSNVELVKAAEFPLLINISTRNGVVQWINPASSYYSVELLSHDDDRAKRVFPASCHGIRGIGDILSIDARPVRAGGDSHRDPSHCCHCRR